MILCITCKALATELLKGKQTNKVYPYCETCKQGQLEHTPELFRELTREEIRELAKGN